MNAKYYCLHCGSEVASINTEGSAYCDIKCENAYAKELRIKLQKFEEQVLNEKEEKINKYLTEALTGRSFNEYPAFINFHTWGGFGKLWEWGIEQDWWKKQQFHEYYSGCTLIDVSYDCSGQMEIKNFHLNEYLINPKRFAYAIYNFINKGIDNG